MKIKKKNKDKEEEGAKQQVRVIKKNKKSKNGRRDESASV